MTLEAEELIVTTVRDPSAEDVGRGEELANALGMPFVVRRRDSIQKLQQIHDRSAALVVGHRQIRLVRDGRSYGHYPNMARLRIARLAAGQGDRLTGIAGVAPGDRILDCTCGMAADAATLAYAAGDNGEVVALESATVLAAIVSFGLANYQHPDVHLVAGMRGVRVVATDYRHFLEETPAHSWDVVYLDPMFSETISHTQGLDLVRMFADSVLPDQSVLRLARRAARRCVVIKDRRPGRLLQRLGVPVVSRSGRTWFGRLDIA